MNTRSRTVALLLIAAVVLPGCAATIEAYKVYDGPELSRKEVAFVVIKDQRGWDSQFRSVDGKGIPAGVEGIAVLPGDHVIVVDFTITESGGGFVTTMEGYKDFEVEALAGATYEIKEGDIRRK